MKYLPAAPHNDSHSTDDELDLLIRQMVIVRLNVEERRRATEETIKRLEKALEDEKTKEEGASGR